MSFHKLIHAFFDVKRKDWKGGSVALPSDAVGGGSASLRCNRRWVVIIECGLASQFIHE